MDGLPQLEKIHSEVGVGVGKAGKGGSTRLSDRRREGLRIEGQNAGLNGRQPPGDQDTKLGNDVACDRGVSMLRHACYEVADVYFGIRDVGVPVRHHRLVIDTARFPTMVGQTLTKALELCGRPGRDIVLAVGQAVEHRVMAVAKDGYADQAGGLAPLTILAAARRPLVG